MYAFDFIFLQGRELENYLDILAELRLEVFKDFPYLYEGDKNYEYNYLSTYIDSPKSLVTLVKSKGRVIAATTCLPLSDEISEIRQPYELAGYDTEKVFYFGESIVLPEFRGNKIGSEFFRVREEHTKEYLPDGDWMSFCAVHRESNHPLRSDSYKDLNSYWQRKGFSKNENIKIQLKWKDLDKDHSDKKTLYAWLKPIPKAN